MGYGKTRKDESVPESSAGILVSNNVTAENCDNPHANSGSLLADHTPQVIAAKRPTTDTPENNVTAAHCDDPHASTPPSSLDNSKSSKLLQLLADHTPKVTPIAAAKRPKARLLTSADCLHMLEEKEVKKKKEAEEKEQRRKDRKEKKKHRKEEAKKTAEKKAKRAEEKAQKAQKVARKTRSTNSRKRPVAKTVNEATIAGTATDKNDAEVIANTTKNESTADRTTEVTNDKNDTEVATDTRTPVLLNESIDPNACCMCFGSYEDDVMDGYGAEWIDYACGQWLHVDCAEDCITDCHGNKCYCPYCLDGLIQ